MLTNNLRDRIDDIRVDSMLSTLTSDINDGDIKNIRIEPFIGIDRFVRFKFSIYNSMTNVSQTVICTIQNIMTLYSTISNFFNYIDDTDYKNIIKEIYCSPASGYRFARIVTIYNYNDETIKILIQTKDFRDKSGYCMTDPVECIQLDKIRMSKLIIDLENIITNFSEVLENVK